MPRERRYLHRLTIPLDEELWGKLDDLSRRFQQSMAEVVRQMIAQQTVQQFPASWQRAAEERRRAALIDALLQDVPDGCTLLVDLARCASPDGPPATQAPPQGAP
jgi:predicted transcriptional regulator